MKKDIFDLKKSLNTDAYYHNLVQWANKGENFNEILKNKALEEIVSFVTNKYADYFVVSLPKGKKLFRARPIDMKDCGKYEKGLYRMGDTLYGYNWKESKEPPARFAKSSRLSEKGKKALYLAADEITACIESRPEVRQYVSVATFSLKQDLKKVLNFSRFDINDFQKNDISDQIYIKNFMLKILFLYTKPVVNNNEYKITQKITNVFRKKGFKGFIYKSFCTSSCNYVFFDEYIDQFQWERSRVLWNYATASKFLSLDNTEGHMDIDNANRIILSQEELEKTRKGAFEKNYWTLSLSEEDGAVLEQIKQMLADGKKVSQKIIADKVGISLYKTRKIFHNLKEMGMVEYKMNGSIRSWVLKER